MTRFLWLLCALALLLPSSRVNGGGEPNGVSLAITMDRRTAKLGDRILIEAQLRNMTERPVAFWGELLWGYRGGLILHVLREDGSEVPSRPRVDESIIPSELRKLSSYVTVQPAHTFGVVRSDRVSALVDSPGTYRISVEYLSPLPRNYANVQNLWTRGRGAIRSPEVELTVTH
jgi:hypothetical protein